MFLAPHRAFPSCSEKPYDRLQEYKKLQDAYLKANDRWFRAYKDWAKCRLESRTDWRIFETVGAFVESTLNILARTPTVSLVEIPRRIEFSMPFERRRHFNPCAVWKLECLTHLCPVSVFLDYSILSGNSFARAPIL